MTFADCAALRMWRQKTRAKGAVKGSTSLRKMGSSTSLFSSVGLRRPPAFGLPVPLRAQSLGYGSVQRSAFSSTAEVHQGSLVSHGRGFWPKCHLPIQAEFVPENQRTVGSGRTRTRRSRRAAIKLATGGAPFLSLYALQVTGSWLRVAQTWIRQDCLPVKSYRRGRPSPLNAFFKKSI